MISITETGQVQTVIPDAYIEELNRHLRRLKESDGRPQTEMILHQLDKTLRDCWTKLELPLEDIEALTGIPGTIS